LFNASPRKNDSSIKVRRLASAEKDITEKNKAEILALKKDPNFNRERKI